jgi:Domain of unknown function (DUF4382)
MRVTTSIVAAVVAITFATACDSSTGNDTTPLTLLLTDAVGEVQEAVVTISSIYLQGDGSTDEASGRVMLRTTPITTNLVSLADDIATIVDAMEVPSGQYGQLRFVIEGAYIKVSTDTEPGYAIYSTPGYSETPEEPTGVLQCPSCSQSGLKVTLQGNLQLDGTAQTLLVDFNVADSFGQAAGNSGMWVMSPSIKASPFEPPAV